jgi:ATP-dependent DNA ligase
MRNYRAMHPPKLARCIAELEAREGDAYQRVVDKGEDVESHLNAARDAGIERGVDWEEKPAKAEEPKPEPTYIPPQLAYDANGNLDFVPERHRDLWVMEPKWDGWRWQVHIEADGVRSIPPAAASASRRTGRSTTTCSPSGWSSGWKAPS